LPRLDDWAETAIDPPVKASRRARIRLAFGADGWEEERALDRYEVMYEAGLVDEARRSRGGVDDSCEGASRAVSGRSMRSDHRRILATAIGRLRGKLKYRPIIFRLTPPRFTLFGLQKAVESLVGFEFHKQNFRRSVEAGGFVVRTDQSVRQGSGRPAALFTVSDAARRGRLAAGLAIPRMKEKPQFFDRDEVKPLA
ncbi:MAG: NAD regulator, partial [Pseudomonadota bacterium]